MGIYILDMTVYNNMYCMFICIPIVLYLIFSFLLSDLVRIINHRLFKHDIVTVYKKHNDIVSYGRLAMSSVDFLFCFARPSMQEIRLVAKKKTKQEEKTAGVLA